MNLDEVVQRIQMRFLVLIQIADIAPISFGDVAVQSHVLFEHERKEILAEVVIFMKWNELKDLRFNDIDTGVDGVAEHFAPRRLFEKSRDLSLLVCNHDTILQRILRPCKDERGFCFFLFMKLNGFSQVKIRQHVAADDHEPFIQKIGCIADTAGSPIVSFGSSILHGDFVCGSISKMRGNDIRLIEERRDDVPYSVTFQ